jgi:hypothetical protein
MLKDKSKACDRANAAVVSGSASVERVQAGGVFTFQCFDKEGNLKWEDKAHNLVVNEGLQDMNQKYFTGVTYTATWYIGLYGAAATNDPTANDTAASHPGFTEITPYSNATRPACSFGTATTADPSVITNALSVAVFAINATATVGGAFLISDNTKGGTAGVLFSAVDFDAPGDRNVVSGDTINVRYDFTLDAA